MCQNENGRSLNIGKTLKKSIYKFKNCGFGKNQWNGT